MAPVLLSNACPAHQSKQILVEVQERHKRWSRFEDPRKHLRTNSEAASLEFTEMQLQRLMKKNEIQRRLDEVRAQVCVCVCVSAGRGIDWGPCRPILINVIFMAAGHSLGY
jgi:hypothetical protein